MNILVINQNASNEYFSGGAGERHYYLAKILRKQSLFYEIISSSGNHLLSKRPQVPFYRLYRRQVFNKNLVFTWVKGSKVNLNSGLSRVASWIRFCVSLFFIRLKERPNVVVLSSTGMLPIIYCMLLRKKYKCSIIFEVRDIWPLSLHEIGGISKKNIGYLIIRKLEILAHSMADHVVSVLPNYQEYLRANFPEKLGTYTCIPNGINVDTNSLELKPTKLSMMKR